MNTAYSNSGVIGESDAEILIGLKPGRKQPTRYYIDDLRERSGRGIPRHAILFSAGGHDQPDPEFRSSRAQSISSSSARTEEANYQLAQQITNRIQHIPGAVDVHVQQLRSYPGDFPECRPHAGAVRGLKPAGRGQQRPAHAEFELPGQSIVLGQPGQRL